MFTCKNHLPGVRGDKIQDRRRHLSGPADMELLQDGLPLPCEALGVEAPLQSLVPAPAAAGRSRGAPTTVPTRPQVKRQGTRGEMKHGTASYQQRAASRCLYLLMKPSPSLSQVWKRHLILSSSPVLEVSVLLLPAPLTSATASPPSCAPFRRRRKRRRRWRRRGCFGRPGFPVPPRLQSASGSMKPGGHLRQPRTRVKGHPGRVPAGARSEDRAAEARSSLQRRASSGAEMTAGADQERAGAVASPGPAALSAGDRRVRSDSTPPRGLLVLLGLGRAQFPHPGMLLWLQLWPVCGSQQTPAFSTFALQAV